MTILALTCPLPHSAERLRRSPGFSLTWAERAAESHRQSTCETVRKSCGQFFTPSPVADFMAGLFQRLSPSVRLLDAGAGVGVLTAAVCDRLAEEAGVKHIEAELFETDPAAVFRLSPVLTAAGETLSAGGVSSEFRIVETDFVLESVAPAGSLFSRSDEQQLFDLAIMNPPYFKLRADSPHARAAQRLGASQPNIYSLFLAAAIERLVPGGELVAITPRSFCNGRYFRDFRRWLFDKADLLQIHAFGSRTETFREAQVLQESIITHFRRRAPRQAAAASVVVTRSFGREFEEIERQTLPREQVVDDSCGDQLVGIPETSQDAEIIGLTEQWPLRFSDTGLQISTGPVVMFRTRAFHAETPGPNTVPLITSHHVRDGKVIWPREKKKWPSAFIADENSRKHLVPVANYVLVKRFTAKEERRRLVAGVLASQEFPFDSLAIENHVNYISHKRRELSATEAVGVAAVFNSALLDRLFRSISGNTQVNATEVRTMKFPAFSLLEDIGRALAGESLSDAEQETIVMDHLRIPAAPRRYLESFLR